MGSKNIIQENSIKKIESEKKLERNLSKLVKELGGMDFKFVPLHVAGIPDRLCLLPGGIMFFAEIKTTRKKLGKLQIIMRSKLIKLGFKVYVIDKTQDLIDLKKEYA